MRFFVCAAALLALVVPTIAGEKQPKSYQIPYKLTPTNHVMVRVKFNNKGPFNLIMDTGAPAIFLATKVAKKVGVESKKDGWGTFNTLELEGGLKLTGVQGVIADPFQLDGMNSMGIAGVELHGMIGYNLLAQFKITYDFTSDKLTLTELPDFKPDDVMRLGGGKGGQGGLEAIGSMMKLLGPMMGFKGIPVRKPRGFVGIEVDESQDAVVVKAVLAGSPADEAGIKPGDKLKKFNKEGVDRLDDLAVHSAKQARGDEITLLIERNGEEKQITLTLGKGL